MRLLIVFLSFFLFFLTQLSANEPILLNDQSDILHIDRGVYYLIDKDGKQSIDTIVNEKNLLVNQKNTLNFGYSSDPVWIKLPIRNESLNETRWLLEIAFPPLDFIEIYIPSGDKYIQKKAGDRYPFWNRDFYYHHLLYSIDLPYGEEKNIYLRIQTTSSRYVPIIIHKSSQFVKNVMPIEILHIIIFGCMFVMIFYNLFIYFGIRSNRYLLYSLGTFGLLLYYFAVTGYGFQFIWPNSVFIQQYVIVFSVSWAGVFITEFTIQFLELKKRMPRIVIIFRISQILAFLIFITVFISSRLANTVQSVVASLNSLLFLLVGIIVWVRGYRSARLFVIGWCIFFAGIILNSMRNLGLFEIGLQSQFLMEIGTVFELIFLSLALADQYKLIVDESNLMQKEILQMQIKYSESLEINVRQRTDELNTTLKSIRDDLLIAKQIQHNTLLIPYNLIDQIEIVPVYLTMSEVGGDFYSVDKLNEDTYRIFLADATGHGVQAALITMAIKGLYDNIKQFNAKPSVILELFNSEFVQRYKSLNTFCTTIILDIDTKNRKIKYASAGHSPCVLFQNKRPILLEKTGKIIGITQNQRYSTIEYNFNLEDRLFLYTDGCFEEFNEMDEEFGEMKLLSSLVNTLDLPLKDSIQNLLSEIRTFIGSKEMNDDITILGIEYKNN